MSQSRRFSRAFTGRGKGEESSEEAGAGKRLPSRTIAKTLIILLGFAALAVIGGAWPYVQGVFARDGLNCTPVPAPFEMVENMPFIAHGASEPMGAVRGYFLSEGNAFVLADSKTGLVLPACWSEESALQTVYGLRGKLVTQVDDQRVEIEGFYFGVVWGDLSFLAPVPSEEPMESPEE
jgi:hypothetical protein